MIALRQAWAILPLLPQAALAAPASPIVPEAYRWLAVAVFAAVIGLALLVTFVAARRARTAAEFYTVGNGLSAARNGWAIRNCWNITASGGGRSPSVSDGWPSPLCLIEKDIFRVTERNNQ